MTQAELSALSGIGKSSISQYLSGKNEPNYANIKKLAEALQVNESFLDGSEEFMDDESKEFDKNLLVSLSVIMYKERIIHHVHMISA